ncbi:ribonuclease H-like protein [Annulohypoxylon moriforme]|nr:ribonuclease H-like protein [Annulohypoxylon moriforme]
MPLGWYHAQGMYPLGPSSSDDEEGPCELPDGRIVCGPHGFVVCDKCCTDYSSVDNVPSKAKNEGDNPVGNPVSNENIHTYLGEPEKRRGTGRIFPTKFNPPTSSITPTELFPGKATYAGLTRYVHRNDPRSVLIFTDGACLDNGQPNPKAGWAFVHGPGLSSKPAITAGRLESKGPFGDDGIQSSNRAEIRAVIAALRFRHWPGEGFNVMTIATDSEYVAEGSTEWARTWVKSKWETNTGADVKNKDLWEMLLGEVERWNDKGLSIRFWRIPRDWNKIADAAAKEAALEDKVPDQWMDISGICL